MDESELEALQALSENELLIRIGTDVSRQLGRHHFAPPSPKKLAELATNWMQEKSADFRRVICCNEHIRNFHHPPSKGLIIHIVVDAILTLKFDVHAGAVAVYLLQKGIDKLCTEGKK